MSSFTRTLASLAVLALPLAAAHADTFSGSAAFSDNGPSGNGVNYSGSFNSPSFSFSGPVGTTYTNLLTITATSNLGTLATDNISVQLTFTAPSAASDTISGTGSSSDFLQFIFFGTRDNYNDIDWSNNNSLINFSNGAQLRATLPDFNFSSTGRNATGQENLTLTVTKTAVTPEPSSLALLGTGLMSVGGILRRRLAR